MPFTKAEFQDAIAHLTGTGVLFGAGALFVDANNQIVLDEGDSNADITPNEATLTQALIDLATAQSTKADDNNTDDTSKTDFLDNAQAGIAKIGNDISELAVATTVVELLPIINRILIRQRRMLKATRANSRK